MVLFQTLEKVNNYSATFKRHISAYTNKENNIICKPFIANNVLTIFSCLLIMNIQLSFRSSNKNLYLVWFWLCPVVHHLLIQMFLIEFVQEKDTEWSENRCNQILTNY